MGNQGIYNQPRMPMGQNMPPFTNQQPYMNAGPRGYQPMQGPQMGRPYGMDMMPGGPGNPMMNFANPMQAQQGLVGAPLLGVPPQQPPPPYGVMGPMMSAGPPPGIMPPGLGVGPPTMPPITGPPPTSGVLPLPSNAPSLLPTPHSTVPTRHGIMSEAEFYQFQERLRKEYAFDYFCFLEIAFCFFN